jgi:hypothetical protein
MHVAYVFAMVSSVFSKCFQMHDSSVSSDFRRTLQVFYLNISKSKSGVASPSSLSAVSPRYLLLLAVLARHPPPPPPFLDAGDVQSVVGPTWAHETMREKYGRRRV